MEGTVVSIAVSDEKGVPKKPVDAVLLIADYGIKGDAHAGKWHRQVSLLAAEDINAANEKGFAVTFGDFAENIATLGVDWPALPVGTKVKIGPAALLEITQIGKKCHDKCAVHQRVGDCIMPRKGVFAKVLAGGTIRKQDPVKVLSD
jgi:MOSC domain-containing protein YiiM